MVELMVKLGIKAQKLGAPGLDWSKGLVGAAKSGNLIIVELMIKMGMEAEKLGSPKLDWYDALEAALHTNNMDIIKLIIKNDVDMSFIYMLQEYHEQCSY